MVFEAVQAVFEKVPGVFKVVLVVSVEVLFIVIYFDLELWSLRFLMWLLKELQVVPLFINGL